MSDLRVFAEWLVSMDDSENPEGMDARRTVTLTQIIERAGAALKADEENLETRFTAKMTDHDRATLMLALTLMLMDGAYGLVGSEWPDEQMDRELPLLLAIFDDLGSPWGTKIDPELVEQVKGRIVERQAAREKAAT